VLDPWNSKDLLRTEGIKLDP